MEIPIIIYKWCLLKFFYSFSSITIVIDLADVPIDVRQYSFSFFFSSWRFYSNDQENKHLGKTVGKTIGFYQKLFLNGKKLFIWHAQYTSRIVKKNLSHQYPIRNAYLDFLWPKKAINRSKNCFVYLCYLLSLIFAT